MESEGLKFYRCNSCGNLCLVLVDPNVKPVCCGNEMEIGMERVKTHCRANMRRASANEVPSSRKRISASCFSSVSIRNCMTVDFVATIDNKTSLLDDCNYTTSVLQMQGGL